LEEDFMKTLLIAAVLLIAQPSLADNYMDTGLEGLTMTLEQEVLLDRVIEPSPESGLRTFTVGDFFILDGALLSASDFEQIHDGRQKFCKVSVHKMDTEEPVTIPAGSLSSLIESSTSLKGYNWKNGRYNWVSARSYDDESVEGEAYISMVTCSTPEPGFFRKPQMTGEDLIQLVQGVISIN
jgi:hypothetical protein